MRIFALGTGRNGSTTLVHAAEHATNFTSGHETLAAYLGDKRFRYPDHHLESDNRLSWFLGQMNELFPDALYVHLQRDPEATARSFVQRWDQPAPSIRHPRVLPSRLRQRWTGAKMGIMRAYAYGIVQADHHEDRMAAALSMVETVNANIAAFLSDKRSVPLRLEHGAEDFTRLWEAAGMEGDFSAAVAEYNTRHNPSRPS